MPLNPGKTPNPDYADWEARKDKVEEMLDKVTNCHNVHGPKWREKTTRYYKQMLANVMQEKPPRYLEDIGVEPLPSTPPPNRGGTKKSK